MMNRSYSEHFVIAIAATFTAEPVGDSLAFWAQKLDLPCQVQFSLYNQTFQQLLDPSSLFSKNDSGVNVILVRFEDWQRFEEDSASAHSWSETCAKVERNVHDLALALNSAARRSTTPHLICICPASPNLIADPDRAAFLSQAEKHLASELEVNSGVYVVTSSDLLTLYPVSEYHDPHGDELGHIPYTSVFFTALGTMIVRKIQAIRRAPYKVIALDCDQTLWKGICGEDGARGVTIDPPWRKLQEFMVAQHDAGMLLCLCSKNDERDVLQVFEHHSEMPLKREHIVSRRINWRPKSENLESLASELRLGLDSFIFLDDSPVECAEVRAHCPQVVTLQLPRDADHIPRFLDHVWAFDRVKITETDRKRSAFYRQDEERERLRGESLTFEDFLAGLELDIQISAATQERLARVAQLTQRTNQFNVTAIRRTEGEIQHLIQSGAECRVVQVRDRFGDYGLVGVMIFEADAEAIDVDTFLLSCRALGRGVEQYMLAWLGEEAKTRGCERVDVWYVPTERNLPALAFLERVGEAHKTSEGERVVFRIPAGQAQAVAQAAPVKEQRPLNQFSNKTWGEV